MKTDHSFEPLLRKWLKNINPSSVLEWGPGKSTKIIHNECPNSKILSIENNKDYWAKMAAEHPYSEIIFSSIPSYGPSDYSCWPLIHRKEKYDLIFIDGRQRVSCLVSSMYLISESGVIIIHDSERIQYKHGISLFNMVDCDEYTSVLKSK